MRKNEKVATVTVVSIGSFFNISINKNSALYLEARQCAFTLLVHLIAV